MKIIDKREKSIESLRNKNLEAFYNNDIVSPENLMNLGLNMYIKDKKYFKQELYAIFNQSKIDDKKILHPQQIEVLKILLQGNNLLLSAPTSFGKTFIALEYIYRAKSFKNIVFVIPTIALMNELSTKIRNIFNKEFNIITNSFEQLEEKNIFILVPERIDIELLEKIKLVKIDLLIFDEIYKLKRKETKEKDKRIISLNKGYFDMVNKANQTILLGPFIKNINFNRTDLNNNIVKYFSDYAPVYIKPFYQNCDSKAFIVEHFKNPNNKLVYFDSPKSIYDFCTSIDLNCNNYMSNSLTTWCDKYISSDWLPSKFLKKGIGIHHGNIPAFMRRYIEYLYNKEKIINLLCTSTLLEGINTPTNELIIYDSKKLSSFQTNNLIGRVGRLDTFKKGIIYYFDKKIENDILGDEKYENIEIVAEENKIDQIEELIYLQKNQKDLSEDQKKVYDELCTKLKPYDKNINDIKKADIFSIESMIKFLDNIPELFKLLDILKKLKDSDNPKDNQSTTRARGNIIKLFTKIIPDSNKTIIQINKESKERVELSTCVGALLVLNTGDIYKKINNQIEKNRTRLSEEKLNLFIDYLFHLAFGYIKYELSKIVKYCEFIFTEKYLEKLDKYKKELVKLLNEDILRRFEMFNCENNKIIKILLDIGIPYSDAKKIEKLIKISLDDTHISTGKILNYLDENKEMIKQKTKIEDVTKDLLDMIV